MIPFILIFVLLIFITLFFLNLKLYLVALTSSLLILFCLFIVLLMVIREAIRTFKGNAPYLPSPKRVINKILEEIDFKNKAVVLELGCGDARFLRAVRKKKNVIAIGYEYFIVPYITAILHNLFLKNKIKIHYQDFFKTNLAEADYIFCFLITEEMNKLEEKLKRELKSGALVISNSFTFKNWQPEKTIVINKDKKTGFNNKIYVYRQP
ncbi:MAG: hypothetical protein NTX00_03290 [Candidatus Parcubacteria bacterium]|nr:hypothetical protein [Candidatus Parcubacteria bacterium]